LIATQSQAQSARTVPSPAVADPVVKLYPNPATAYITFEIQKISDKGLTVQVFSFLGKKMYESAGPVQKVTIDLAAYNRGLYMYHLVDATGRVVKNGKFQVTK